MMQGFRFLRVLLDAFEVACSSPIKPLNGPRVGRFYGEGLKVYTLSGPVLLPLAGPQSHRHIELQRELGMCPDSRKRKK